MKIYNYTRNVFTLITNGLLFLTLCGTSQAINSETESRRVGGTTSAEAVIGGARLIITRIPNLGNHVIVDLNIDGVAASPIAYGQTYKGLLSPGRHVLSVQASPHPKWMTKSKIILNVRKGETYNFTAMSDGSGNLILKGV
jgi:hypothetical protein